MIAPRPLKRTCWSQLMGKWGIAKISNCVFQCDCCCCYYYHHHHHHNHHTIIIIIIIMLLLPALSQSASSSFSLLYEATAPLLCARCERDRRVATPDQMQRPDAALTFTLMSTSMPLETERYSTVCASREHGASRSCCRSSCSVIVCPMWINPREKSACVRYWKKREE